MSNAATERFLEALGAALERCVPEHSSGRFAVAFSGGLDSTVLLAAMAHLERQRESARDARGAVRALRALHVDHALHRDSADWERHCGTVAAALGVPYDSVRVVVDRDAPTGLEAAARESRYAAFASLVDDGETLLTAHHADDQLETLLLRMLRGTGVRGLRGILPCAPLGRGAVARPLLDFGRDELRAQARRWRLVWLEDPSNRDVDLDRNYLRARVVPLLCARWGAAARSAGRLAAAMVDAETILAAAADADLAGVASPERIPLDLLRGLDPARRRNLLRRALHASGLPIPTAAQLEQLAGAADVVRPDAKVRIAWPGVEARVWRRTLYLLTPHAAPMPERDGGRVSADAPWRGPEGGIALTPVEGLAPGAGEGLPEPWAREGLHVRFRTGGERFRPAGDAHTRTLKHWFQQQGVVPWMRERIPLLYRGDRLVAVADLAVADDVRQVDAPRWRVEWSDHPALY